MKATTTDVSKRIEVKPSKTDGIINYDIDNAYPQRIIDIINASGTGTLCTDLMQKFIFGGHFKDERLGSVIVNSKGLTANALLKKSARSLSRFNGLALHVNYNALFVVSEINIIPFEDLRFTTPDHKKEPNKIAVYHDWQKIESTKIDWKKVDFINFYDSDPEVVQEQVIAAGGFENYNGQILYWTTDGLEYPLAPSDSVLEDIQTDSQSKLFKFRNIITNFMASHILESEAFESDDEKFEFLDTLKDFQGADDTSKILLLEKTAGQPESGFNLQKVDIQDVGELYQYTEESVRDNILRNYLIPPVLLLAVAGKLGSSSEIKDATAFYNSVTKDYRLQLSETLGSLLSGFKGTSFDDYTIRKVEAETVEVKDTIEGKAKIIELLSSTAISEPQKLVILQKIYGFNFEDASELVKTLIVE